MSRELDIRWLVLTAPDNEAMLAKLGWFSHGGVARLQEVVTERHHRHRGYATALVSEAIREALATGIDVLGLCADDSVRPLYEPLGFKRIASLVSFLRVKSDAGKN